MCAFISATVDVWDILEKSGDAMQILHQIDCAVVECGCYHSLGCLEALILNAAASPGCAGALLYMTVLKVEIKHGRLRKNWSWAQTLYPISEWNRTVYPSLKWSGWDASIPRPPMPEDTRDILQEVYHIHNFFKNFLAKEKLNFMNWSWWLLRGLPSLQSLYGIPLDLSLVGKGPLSGAPSLRIGD